MWRLWVVLLFVLACACKDDKRAPAPEVESEGERAAKQIRESFRIVLADFHADVVAGRLDAAYARLAPMYRVRVSLEQFSMGIDHWFFRDGTTTFIVRSTSATAGTAKASVLMKGPLGTSQLDVRYTAVYGAWTIAGIMVDGTPLLP
jgi:hypothetical protein